MLHLGKSLNVESRVIIMVVVRIWEGLGNQLFQYAYARALSLRTKDRVYLDISEYEMSPKPVRKYELCHFKIKQPVINCGRIFPFVNKDSFYTKNNQYLRYFPAGLIKEEDCYFKRDFCELKGLLYLKGWFQSEKYFKEFESHIREEIYPRNKIKITRGLRKILNSDNTVSVHIRRGDFGKDHNILPIEYYENSKRVILERVDNPYFIIFSDDILWVKENMNFGLNCFYMDKEYSYKDYEELMIMSRCKHNIIANSTFSWWGAWLNPSKDKIVIAPKKWFLYNPKKDFDIVPNDWIRV
jgi:hypothetical protein